MNGSADHSSSAPKMVVQSKKWKSLKLHDDRVDPRSLVAIACGIDPPARSAYDSVVVLARGRGMILGVRRTHSAAWRRGTSLLSAVRNHLRTAPGDRHHPISTMEQPGWGEP